MSLRNTLSGTGVAIITPFKSNGDVDFAALEKCIDHVIQNGVNYIVTLGTTGEAPTIDKAEKKDIIQFTYEKVNNRVPVVVGVGGNNTKALIEDLQSFPLEKATAVLSAAPYYSKPSQEGLFQHYKALAEASPKPIILYNVPGRTGRNMSAATTLRLAHDVANIAGIKEASGDLAQCMEIVKGKPTDFLVVSGDDNLVPAQIAIGMDGVISVAANCFTQSFCKMVQHCLKGEMDAANTIHNKLLEGYDLLFAENNPAGVKAFMAELGLIENHLRLPLVPLSKAWHEKVKAFKY